MKKRKMFLAVILGICMVAFTGCGRQAEDPGTPPEEVIHPLKDTGISNETQNGVEDSTRENIELRGDEAVGAGIENTYDGETGYVGQNIRGTYTRDDETEITDIHTGELYLFGDGQLRLYFKDVEGANILATPVGCVADTSTVLNQIE